MTKTLKVDFTGLTDFGDSLINTITEIEACLTSLKTDFNSLTGVWQGDDSNAYNAKITKTLDNLAIIKSDIKNYGTFTKDTSTAYQGIVNKAKSSLGSG